MRHAVCARGSRLPGSRLWAISVSLFLCTLQREPLSSSLADKAGLAFVRTENGVEGASGRIGLLLQRVGFLGAAPCKVDAQKDDGRSHGAGGGELFPEKEEAYGDAADGLEQGRHGCVLGRDVFLPLEEEGVGQNQGDGSQESQKGQVLPEMALGHGNAPGGEEHRDDQAAPQGADR